MGSRTNTALHLYSEVWISKFLIKMKCSLKISDSESREILTNPELKLQNDCNEPKEEPDNKKRVKKKY